MLLASRYLAWQLTGFCRVYLLSRQSYRVAGVCYGRSLDSCVNSRLVWTTVCQKREKGFYFFTLQVSKIQAHCDSSCGIHYVRLSHKYLKPVGKIKEIRHLRSQQLGMQHRKCPGAQFIGIKIIDINMT